MKATSEYPTTSASSTHARAFETFFYNGKWRVDAKRMLSKNWHWGFADVFALSDLGAGVGYVVKYLTKVHRTVFDGRFDRKSVLTLAMMWIFKKRAFSLSRGFEDLVVEEEMEERRYVGQVDLEGNPIFQWVLVGLWAGNLGVWSKELTHREFFEIYSSKEFSQNINLVRSRLGVKFYPHTHIHTSPTTTNDGSLRSLARTLESVA